MDDFSFFSSKDRQDISYAACVGGSFVVGLAVGRIGMLPGLLAGAAVGVAVGLLTCRKLSPMLERKIFSSDARLTDEEVLAALRIIRDEMGVTSKSDAMYLLAHARAAGRSAGGRLHPRMSCMPPRFAASQLLTHRT